MRVLRVQLQVTDYQLISLPHGAKILHVAPCRSGAEFIDLWYLDTGRPTRRDIGIYVIGTGNPMPKGLGEYGFHLGTAVMSSHLVWHVFEGPVQP